MMRNQLAIPALAFALATSGFAMANRLPRQLPQQFRIMIVDGTCHHRSFVIFSGRDTTMASRALARTTTTIAGPTSTIAMSTAIPMFPTAPRQTTAKASVAATMRAWTI
jgi:hypothetical protein